MSALSALCITAVVIWTALVVIAQLLTPEQSPLSMGMSGLARGPYGWVMKVAFVVRGVAALALVAAIPGSVPSEAQSTAGMALLWVWGLGSALLAVYATDMPGEAPSGAGKAHTFIALVAYVAAGIGMILVSVQLDDVEATAWLARWALPIALIAAVALLAQFAGFAAAARDARAKTTPDASSAAGAPGAAGAAGAASPSYGGLGRYAGLLQRVFLALVMLWTVVVAAGI